MKTVKQESLIKGRSTAGDKLLEEKLKWRAEVGTSYMGLDAAALLDVLRTNPSHAWDLLESSSGNLNLRKAYGGSKRKKAQGTL